ncbi:MAG TPA: pilus assembly protein PilP [Vicinamibacterales bacterium]|jgi:Tfp pilus assembly protein PilP
MTSLHAIRLGLCAALVAAAWPVVAQTPAPAAAPVGQKAPANATPATPKVDLPTPPANFEYTIDGRRDPFVSLVNRGSESGVTSPDGVPVRRAEGVPGMLTGELKVRGIVQTRGVWVAMVSGADNKVYTVRAGDKVADGVIRTITATAVVIFQEVNDPLSLQKQREVRKFLRGGEEVK